MSLTRSYLVLVLHREAYGERVSYAHLVKLLEYQQHTQKL
jgi:hypothetical protein